MSIVGQLDKQLNQTEAHAYDKLTMATLLKTQVNYHIRDLVYDD
jgi:hypothetical protein